jgi:capsid assembly protease
MGGKEGEMSRCTTADRDLAPEVARLHAAVRHSPLALREKELPALRALFDQVAGGQVASPDQLAGAFGSGPSPERQPGPRGVAVIPVAGLIVQHPSIFTRYGLAVSTEELVAQVRAAVADAAIRAIVLSIESPGGFTYGVSEAAAAIRGLREQKPISAVANSYAASAAYWLASAASELVVTPSGDVGAIGVFAVHEDWSRAYEKAGVKPTLVRAGKYKAEFSDLVPLTDDARAELQRTVEASFETFITDVALGRRVSAATVREGFGQGRMVSAQRAVRLGMADRVASLSEVVQGWAAGPGASGRAARAAGGGLTDDARSRRQRLREAVWAN